METWLDEAGELKSLSALSNWVLSPAAGQAWRAGRSSCNILLKFYCPYKVPFSTDCVVSVHAPESGCLGNFVGVYCPLCCTRISLPELADLVLHVVLQSSQLLVLRDFSIPAETSLSGGAQDFMSVITAKELSKVIDIWAYLCCTLDIVFCTGLMVVIRLWRNS